MPELVLFAGRSSAQFGQEVSTAANIRIGGLDVVPFSDGELSIDIKDNVRGRDVFIVQSTSRPVNEALMELLIVIDALKRASAFRISAVLPYFGYARQDRKLKPRVPITARLVADLITTAGAHRVLTMDLHAGQIMGFFNIPVDNLNAAPVLIPYIRETYGADDMVMVSPDVGGVERARYAATHLNNVPIAIIDKRRSGPNQIAEMNVVGEVKGKTCIIVEDMIDTGGTIVKAAETLKREGAGKVIVAASHGVFSGPCLERLRSPALDQVVITNSIYHPESDLPSNVTVLSVAKLFGEAINRIHREDSISSLFI